MTPSFPPLGVRLVPLVLGTLALLAPSTPAWGQTSLQFGQQPTDTEAGATISPAVTVRAVNSAGNTVTSYDEDVTIEIGTNPAGGNLSGTLTVAAVNGVATFGDLSIDQAGEGYTLVAASGELTEATSEPFDITPVAVALAFVQQPTDTEAGATISPAVTVRAVDDDGNTVVSFTEEVTIAIGTNPGGGVLSGTVTVAAVDGVATFGDLAIDQAGDGYTLTATSDPLTSATSDPFDILAPAGVAVALAFVQQPTDTEPGVAISPAVTVRAVDDDGNTVTSFTGDVTIAIGTNPAGGSLSGATTVTAVDGVATFADLSIDQIGAGYTLVASSSGLTGATSDPFDVLAALEFLQQPTDTQAGATITPAVTVRAVDGNGDTVTSFTGEVAIAIGTNPGGGVLLGTTRVDAEDGVATFDDLSIDEVGVGYTLTASGSGLTAATSDPFDITPKPAVALAFVQQPTDTQAGATISPGVTVRAVDEDGNTATSFTGNVTIAIGTNPGGGTLSGTTTVAAVDGVATFSDLSIDEAGVGYTLTASASGPTGATSAPFTITPKPPVALAFVQQPTDTQAGATISPAVTVRAVDEDGDTATSFTGTVTVAIGANPAGGTLSGTTTVAAVDGVATFSTLSIDKAGAGYTLVATSGTLGSATSDPFTITPGPASRLVFGQQPSDTRAGDPISPAVTVRALDASGNLVTTFTSNVSILIAANPGGGTLSGTTTVAAVGGVATFADLSIDQPGDGYTLIATSGALADATSEPFDILAHTAARLRFVQQPSDTEAGATIAPAVTLRAVDDAGDTVTSFTGDVTIAIGTNPGGGTLSGATTVAAVDGVATFADLSIDRAGSGYTLAASASGLTGATSAPFDVMPGPASGATSTITAAPTSVPADGASSATITVELRDALGNALGSGGDTVVLATTAGTLGGVTDHGDGTYTAILTAPSSPATATVSGTVNGIPIADTATVTFTAVAPVATRLAFVQQPTDTQTGATIAPPVTVRAVDDAGAIVPSFTGNVTITIGANPAGGTLSGTTTVAAVNGVATFGDLSIDRAGAGYTLIASASGLNGATSASFAVLSAPDPGAASTILADPTEIPADGTSTSTILVQVRADDGTPLTVGGSDVRLSTTAGTLGPVRDNEDGTYTATLTSSTTPATATISGTVDGRAIVDTATVEFVPVPTDLAVTASVDDPTPTIGEMVVYTIRATNQGPGRARGVEVSFELSERLAFVSSTASQGSYDPQTGLWSIGALEPDETATLEIAARVVR